MERPTAQKVRKRMKNLLTFILLLYMINNLEHSTHVYYGISKKQLAEVFGWQYADWFQSVLVIVVLDLSVMAWIRMSRYWEAGTFIILIWILNLLYYEWPGLFTSETNQRIAEFIFSVMFCFGFISVSYLSAKSNQTYEEEENLSEESQTKMIALESNINQLESAYQDINVENNQLKLRVNQLEEENEQIKSKNVIQESMMIQIKTLSKELDSVKKKDELSRTCEYCEEILDSSDSKRVHKGKCSKNPKNLEKLDMNAE